MSNTSIVIGSTGLVGNLLLTELSNKNIDVLAITRKPIKENINNIKVLEIDFDSFLSDGKLPSCEHLYICLGTTIKKAGSQEEFKKVDFEYALAFAEKAKEAGAVKVSLVSSVGANHKSKNFYLRVKGEIEEAIKKINFEQINIYRPSLLIGARSQSRFLEQLGQNFSFIINLFLWGPLKKYRSIKAQDLSQSIAMHNDKKGISYFYYDNFI
jgi:uncharacterized protein YbjT (DUF2867 family)|tara:strand:- start:404 stop:1039 length:636 start_codon:yes stop_codon:yes gene_type:complete